MILPNNFETSQEIPSLQIKDASVMKLNVTDWQQNHQMTYSINHLIDDVGVDLVFTGTTVGWKYITSHEGWTVALPKARMQG
jgi:hypothetical protein